MTTGATTARVAQAVRMPADMASIPPQPLHCGVDHLIAGRRAGRTIHLSPYGHREGRS